MSGTPDFFSRVENQKTRFVFSITQKNFEVKALKETFEPIFGQKRRKNGTRESSSAEKSILKRQQTEAKISNTILKLIF